MLAKFINISKFNKNMQSINSIRSLDYRVLETLPLEANKYIYISIINCYFIEENNSNHLNKIF